MVAFATRHVALLAVVGAICFSAAFAFQPLGAQPAPRREPAPLINEGGPGAIPGEYNVVFNVGRSPRFRLDARETRAALALARRQNLEAQATVRRMGGVVHHSYDTAIVGFTAKLTPAALDAVRRVPGVAYVEPEIRYRGDTVQTISSAAPKRGIDRIDRRVHPLDNVYTYSETGAGVNVYVIDTGILAAHQDFQGRAFGLRNFVPGAGGVVTASDTNDCHGHGTHVAGIIGGGLSGVAKGVKLFALRALDCQKNADPGNVTAAINAAAAHAQLTPNTRAVVNMSLSGLGVSTAQQDAIIGAMTNQRLVFVVSAGNNNANACDYMPAGVDEVITVGAVAVGDPNDVNAKDTREATSNVGPCLDLFAPGVRIYSAIIANADDPQCPPPHTAVYCFTRTFELSGTSQAAPHVAGVAARYLQAQPTKTPSEVWTAIHNANNVAGTSVVIGGVTKVWPGVIEATTNAVITTSVNEMLHYGSLADGYNDGEPHITTVDGLRYDFQGAGEFVALKEANGFEIQTRTAPVATAATPLVDPYTGLANCVSVNTAVAARLGNHRVTFQPNPSGRPGMQLRVDGQLTVPGASGLHLDGVRIMTTPAGGIDVGFPDGTEMIVTPGLWMSIWYLNLAVLRTTATQGIMGARPAGSWLPALPDGSSVGPMPASLPNRHIVLNEKFTDAWRVGDASSLFDYAPGTSSATFARRWPPADGHCALSGVTPARPVDRVVAERLCRPIADKARRENCTFDVIVTGDAGFAKTYQLAETVQNSSTRVAVHSDAEWGTRAGEPVTFTAIVEHRVDDPKRPPRGVVTFILDGREAGRAKLDRSGRALWRAPYLAPGAHKVSARFTPADRASLPSLSLATVHAVAREGAAAK